MVDVRAARALLSEKKLTSRGRGIPAEMRADDAAGLTFCGYASITGVPYAVHDWLGEYDETIARGAFTKSLKEQDDVRLLINHEGVPIARTKSGTLMLSEISDPADDPQGRGQTGLWCEASLDPSNPRVQEVRSAMDRGDLEEMSFAFQATRQEWNDDYSLRTVNELRMFDVSVVTYPANPATSASLEERKDADSAVVLSIVESSRLFDESQRELIREAFEAREAMVEINVTIGAVEPDGDEVEPDGDEPDATAEPADDPAEPDEDDAERFQSALLESALVDSSLT